MALPSTGSDSGNVLVIVKDGGSGFKVTKNHPYLQLFRCIFAAILC